MAKMRDTCRQLRGPFPARKMLPTVCLVILIAAQASNGVDRSNFKTCDQSAFCKRNRALQPGKSPYELQLNTLKVEASRVEAILLNTKNEVQFTFQLYALADSMFRMKVNEAAPLKARYEVEYVLVGEPTLDKLEVKDRNADEVTVVSGKNKAVIHARPFRVDLYSGEDLVMVVNARGLMKFEHLRLKQQEEHKDAINGVDGAEAQADGQVPAEEEEDETGMWEETFKSHTDSKPNGPTSVGLDVSFIGVQHVYGIPQHADSFPLKETTSTDPYRMYNFDVFEYELQSGMALYGSIPVMYAHSAKHTVGMFWLNAAETWVDIGVGPDRNVVSSLVSLMSGSSSTPQMDTHWISESGIIDIFFMMGPGPRDVAKQYSKLTGVTPLPQYFSLGYHQSRWNYNDQDDVNSVDAGFDEHDIPLDSVWLDIEHTDGKKYFTWDKRKFPNPKEMVLNLTAKGRKLVMIVDPHIKRASDYFLHNDATSNGYYVKNKDGNDYEGWCWPGSASYLDFFNPVVRDYWASRFALDKFEGTTQDVYIWNDMNEPSVFNGPEVTMNKDCIHHGGWEHRDVHNLYGLATIMATFQGLLQRSEGKLRPFILTRAHFAGSQRYASVWTGDNMAKWEHLQISIPMCLSLAITGMGFCGADVGGFFYNVDGDLLSRWYQAGAFQPFFRAHSHIDNRRREPWVYDEETKLLIRDAIRKRYTYLPMWYTLFYENELDGLSPMRPLWFQYPKDTNTFGIDDEYMLGNMLLVKPVTTKDAVETSVYFPGNGEPWYDVDTHQKYEGPATYQISAPRDKIPVYQRGGTIIPKKERIRRSLALTHNDPYTLSIAVDKQNAASGKLFVDDGQSYEYRQGKFLYMKFELKHGILKSTFPEPKGHFTSKAWLERVVIVGMSSPPKKVEGSSKSIAKKSLEFTYDPKVQTLVIRKPEFNIGEEWSISMK